MTVLVATWEDGLFAVSGEERRQEITSQLVRWLAPDGRGGAIAIVGKHSLCRREPGGEWIPVATSELELSCCMAVRDSVYVGTDDARMLRLRMLRFGDAGDGFEPMESFDNVAGRDTWYAGSAIVNGRRVGPPLGIRSVSANSNGSVLFANVHVGGIPRSLDGGKTWQPTIDIQSDVHEVCGHPSNPDIVVAACGAGLGISYDAGATWTMECEGLHASHCSAVAISGDDVLVSAAASPFAEQGRVYRRGIAAGGRLAAVEDGLPAWFSGIVDTGCIATDGSAVAVIDRAGTLYLSTDCGRAWDKIGSGLPAPSCALIC